MIAVLALTACGGEGKPSGTAPAATPVASASAPAARAPAPAASAPASASTDAASASARAASVSVRAASPVITGTGAGDCTVARGPVRLATTGAAAFGPPSGGLLTLGTNKDGAAAWEAPRFPDPPRVAPGARPGPRPSVGATALLPAPAASPAADAPAPDRTRLPACAVAGGFSFCADGEGAIHRRPLAGGEDKVVAKGRKGTPVAAASVGGHAFYAFLANQKTTEGLIVRAFVALDDETPIPLSEEGSGATYIGLVARDSDVLAMYIDARTALTPVHARTLRAEGRLVRGPDAVVFVGGGAESHVRGALGRGAAGPALLFIPGSPGDEKFGVIAIPVDGEPKDDMPGKWSYYPAEMLSPALAATRGATPVRLLRARSESGDSGAPSVLELGHVAEDGSFQDRCVLTKGGPFSDLAAAVDEEGSLWITYTNGDGTWVEQRGGEPKGK